MPISKQYQHFCPVARSLEVIGEKWSLLVVRDLLRGPQRFSDLHRYLGGITPKWLTQRLRDLEAAGIVEREQEAGRREVWYRLTEKGRGLAPAIEALAVWGIDHAMRPPLPSDTIFPEQTLMIVAVMLRNRKVALGRPAVWRFTFGDEAAPQTLSTDGTRWRARRGAVDDADVTIDTNPRDLVSFLMSGKRERRVVLKSMRVEGERAELDVMLAALDRVTPVGATAVSTPA